MKQLLWTQNYEVSSFLSNSQKKLGLYALLNLLQDVAWLHATHLGFGYESIIEKKMIWVLARQKLVMDSWPDWGSTVQIRTWVRPSTAPFATRDFEILVGETPVGASTTSWIILDSQSRRPVKRAAIDLDQEFKTERRLAFDAPKIALREDLHAPVQFLVRNSDLDVNQHVNNTRYAQWILDSIPVEWHKRFTLHEYEVNFLAETYTGDTVTVCRSAEPEAEISGSTWVQFQGWRQDDPKPVFAARLRASENKDEG